MPESLPNRLFITGTDTGIGKTVVSAILTLGLKADYFKPVQSGLEDITDSLWVQEKTQLSNSRFHPESYRLTQPLSPHASAAIDGIRIDPSKISLPAPPNRPLVVEGAGGLVVPLNESFFMLDLIEQLKLPVILVARSGLGTINHSLLSLMALENRKIQVLGVVLNGEKNPSNKKAIEDFGKARVLAEVEPIEFIDPQILFKIYQDQFSKWF